MLNGVLTHENDHSAGSSGSDSEDDEIEKKEEKKDSEICVTEKSTVKESKEDEAVVELAEKIEKVDIKSVE